MQMYGKKHMDDLMKKREFWDNQPVPQPHDLLKGNIEPTNGPIQTKTIDQVKKEPVPLPEGFEWGVVDIDNPNQLEEVSMSDDIVV